MSSLLNHIIIIDGEIPEKPIKHVRATNKPVSLHLLRIILNNTKDKSQFFVKLSGNQTFTQRV